MESKPQRRFFEVTAPQGTASYIATVTGAASIDLRTIGNTATDISNSAKTENTGAVDSFIDIQNDGAVNLYVETGPTAPVVDPGAKGLNQAAAGYMIQPGMTLPGIWLRPGVDLFLGFCAGTNAGASGTTVMRVFVTSRFG